MALPNEKLATSLEALTSAGGDAGVIRSASISRTHRERLTKAGFLLEVMPGWYLVDSKASGSGESVLWYTSFWKFISMYLAERFGKNYHLAAESSILAHVGTSVPQQIYVNTSQNINQVVSLLFGTSVVIYTRKSLATTIVQDDVNLMTIEDALCEVPEVFFASMPLDAEIAMKMVRDPSGILSNLLSSGKSTFAGRLAGAYRFIGKPDFADAIVSTMKSVGYDVRESNPFKTSKPMLSSSRVTSPYAERIKASWAAWRHIVEAVMPGPVFADLGVDVVLEKIDDIYTHDAYNSLSIEGYKVTHELIEKVRNGSWDPDSNDGDKDHRNAMAARGYLQAFEQVKAYVRDILNGANPAETIIGQRHDWFVSLFAPSVQAGILAPGDLAGFRRNPVYIRDSMHAPPHRDYISDCMDALNDCYKKEPDPAVRAVLGHFFFVFIHPYPDGNGRTARFMMNATLASAGYPWTVVQTENRKEYFATLEKASVGGDISDFATFIADEMRNTLELEKKLWD